MNRRTLLAGAALVVGLVGVTDGLIVALADDGKAAKATVDAQGRPIIEVDLKAPSRKPELPAKAMAPTEAGATAFVLYWFDALNYSLAHGDVDLLAHHSSAGCQVCTGYLLSIANWKQEGMVVTGGYTAPVSMAIGRFSTTEPVPFVVRFLTSPATLKRPGGAVTEYSGGPTQGGVAVLYANRRWQMTTIVLDASKAKETP